MTNEQSQSEQPQSTPIESPDHDDRASHASQPDEAAGPTQTAASNSSSGWGTAGRILVLVGAAHLTSHYILAGGTPLLLLASVILGGFAYRNAIEMHLLTRRAVAEVGAREGGVLFRLLYRGTLRKIITFAICVGLAGSFLMHANQMSGYIWLWLYLDAAIVVVLLRWLHPFVRTQAKRSPLASLVAS
ncbi:MAG: hypothetical protein R8J84_03670 [Mariprofundales bacterium]